MKQAELTESEQKGFLKSMVEVLRQQGRSLDCLAYLAAPDGRETLEKMMNVGYTAWERECRKKKEAERLRLLVGPDKVSVSDLSAKELLKVFARERKLTFVLGAYEKWNFYRDTQNAVLSGRRKDYEVMVWRPERGSDQSISGREVEKYFAQCGYYGHVGAFIEWLRVAQLPGEYVTIPPADACYYVQLKRGRPIRQVPCSSSRTSLPGTFDTQDARRLSMDSFQCRWGASVGFVGFRELSKELRPA